MLRMRPVVALALAILFLLVEGQALVGQTPTRSGFFIGFGLGAGSFSIEDAEDRETSAAGYFKLGGAVNDRLLLGAESAAWVKEEGGVTVTSGSLSAVAYFYPNPASGFFLQGGLGIASLELDVESFGSTRENGTAFTVGAGFDIGFGGRFGLTPYGSFVFSNFDGGSTSLAHFGLGFNWY